LGCDLGGPKDHALDGDPDPLYKWVILRVKGAPIVEYSDSAMSYARMTEPT